MRIFCIDIGNTRTHCAYVDGKNVLSAADYSTLDFCETFDFSKIDAPISWCSVVPKISAKLSKKLDELKLKHLCLNWENSPIKLDVKNPEQVGQDRIAVAIGALQFFTPPYIVVDMGTAVTIDLVDKNGNYAGGAIAPGLHAFVDYLNEKTAQLPKIDPRKADYSMSVGKNTYEAMMVGCVKGFCKLADGIIADIEKDYFDGKSAAQKTVFTGGSVELLPKKWLAGRKLEANLANIGLAKFLELNFNNKSI